LGLFDLKILLVVILCIPIIVLGIKFAGMLTDAALAGKKKGAKKKKKDDDER